MKRVLRREGPRVPLSNGSAQPSGQIGMAAMSHQPGACSERFVSARHESINKVEDSVAELLRILRVHGQNVP